MRIGDEVAHAITGEVGVIEALGNRAFENHIRVCWNLTGQSYYHRPEFITDVSRAAEIKRAYRKNRPLPDDIDE